MTIIPAVVTRVLAYATALVAFYAALSQLPSEGGANIGAGLLIFAAFALASLVWAFLDARHRDLTQTIMLWAIVGGVFAVGWRVGQSLMEPGSLSADQFILVALATLPFNIAMVVAPAAIGATIGHTMHPAAGPHPTT